MLGFTDVLVSSNVCGHRPDDGQIIAFLRKEGLPRAQPSVPVPHKRQPVQPDTSKPSKRKLAPLTRLHVTMPNGEVIERQHAKTTFIEIIEKFGVERVMSVHPSTVLTEPPKYFWSKHGQFYIHHYASTRAKKRVLEEIARLLDVQLTVKIVTK